MTSGSLSRPSGALMVIASTCIRERFTRGLKNIIILININNIMFLNPRVKYDFKKVMQNYIGPYIYMN